MIIVCIKSKRACKDDGYWQTHSFADFGDIIPAKLNSIEELEQDMFKQLIKYAKKNNLNLFDWN
jgi:hypothetical protein